MNYQITVFNIKTGLVNRRISCQDIDVQAQIQSGEGYIDGDFDDTLYYFPNGVKTLIPPPPPPTNAELLATAKVSKMAELEKAYNVAVQKNVTYMGSIFQADNGSQDLLIKVLVAGGSPYWLNLDNAPITMTPAQLQGLAGTMLAQGQAAFSNLQVKKNAVKRAITVIQVQAITW